MKHLSLDKYTGRFLLTLSFDCPVDRIILYRILVETHSHSLLLLYHHRDYLQFYDILRATEFTSSSLQLQIE